MNNEFWSPYIVFYDQFWIQYLASKLDWNHVFSFIDQLGTLSEIEFRKTISNSVVAISGLSDHKVEKNDVYRYQNKKEYTPKNVVLDIIQED
jgi:hypothetical protein